MGKTIEEKARAYDKALERAKELYSQHWVEWSDKDIESIFPELKESKDEQHRKWILEYLYDGMRMSDEQFKGQFKCAIDWLEKQELKSNPYSGVSFSYNGNIWGMCARDNGVDILFNKKLIRHINDEKQGEQKSTNKTEPKFKVGDKIKLAKEPKYPAREIISIGNDCYYFDSAVYLPFERQDEWELVEQKPADKVEPLTDFEKAFQGMCCEKNKHFAKECCKTLLELAKKQLQPKWDKQGGQKEYTFKSIPRLLEMIEPTDRAKSYCKKFIDTLIKEGYNTDAKIVEEVLKGWNGEDVPMAIMDEQKPINESQPKFHKGDWVVDEDDNSVHQIKCTIENVTSSNFSYDLVGGGYFPSIKKNYHLWSIADAKPGDVLVDKCGNIGIYQGDTNATTWYSCCYCGVNKMFYDEGWHEFPCYPATKEQRDTLLAKMKEAGYEWNAKKKELKKISQRMISAEAKEAMYGQPAWSEEDEIKIKSIIAFLKSPSLCAMDGNKGIIDANIKYLKSIKDRVQSKSQYKPSEEQLYFLHWLATNVLTDGEVDKKASEILNTLYNDLKKL